jgi:hypothetical protein
VGDREHSSSDTLASSTHEDEDEEEEDDEDEDEDEEEEEDEDEGEEEEGVVEDGRLLSRFLPLLLL